MANETVSIDQMKTLLGQKQTKSDTPIATLHKGKGKDGADTIDVTEEVIDRLYTPVLDKVTADLKPVLIQTIADGIDVESKAAKQVVDALVSDTTKEIAKRSKDFENEYAKFTADLLDVAKQVRPIEVRTETLVTAMKGVQHNKFELLLHIVGANLPVFMVGPAGTGKTAGAEQVATALGLDFYAMSVGSQTSKSDIFGFVNATGVFIETAFYKAYTHGGVFLLDEADAGNANVLVGLNAALSNGYVFFPNGVMTKMHPDFRMVATANTFGNGASRQYVGRNQLDAATLDRFTVITWDIDDRIEEAISTISPTFGDRWLRVVRAVRHEAITQLELRAVVSPRATLRGATLLERGVEFEHVVQVALIANMPEAEREVLLNLANATWAKSEGAKKKGRPVGSKNAPKVDLDALQSVFDGAEDVTVDDEF
jgi:MoxR-like ATPase